MSNAFPSLRVVVLTRRFQVPFLIGLGLRPTNYCHQQKICSGHQFAIKVKFTTICFALLSLYISKQERDWKSPFDLNFQNTLLEISYNYFWAGKIKRWGKSECIKTTQFPLCGFYKKPRNATLDISLFWFTSQTQHGSKNAFSTKILADVLKVKTQWKWMLMVQFEEIALGK